MFRGTRDKAQVYFISKNTNSDLFQIIPELKKFFSFDLYIVAPEDKNTILGKRVHILAYNQTKVADIDFEWLKNLHNNPEENKYLHSIFYGKKVSIEDKTILYSKGLDYIINEKIPLKLLEVRIKNIFKRKSDKYEKSTIFSFNNLTIDTNSRKVMEGTKNLHVSPTEFNLLFNLITHPNIPLSREDLFYRVWGYTIDYSRTLDQYIFRLRNRLDQTKIKKTKIGYMLE